MCSYICTFIYGEERKKAMSIYVSLSLSLSCESEEEIVEKK